MLTLLPGDESTTWNDDIVAGWSLHLSVEKEADDVYYILVVCRESNLTYCTVKKFIRRINAFYTTLTERC